MSPQICHLVAADSAKPLLIMCQIVGDCQKSYQKAKPPPLHIHHNPSVGHWVKRSASSRTVLLINSKTCAHCLLSPHTAAQSLDGCTQTRSVVCHWNRSETKVLARLSRAACCSLFMGEITSFTPSSAAPAEHKHSKRSHLPRSWPHATGLSYCFVFFFSLFFFPYQGCRSYLPCIIGEKQTALTGKRTGRNWIYLYCVWRAVRPQPYIS